MCGGVKDEFIQTLIAELGAHYKKSTEPSMAELEADVALGASIVGHRNAIHPFSSPRPRHNGFALVQPCLGSVEHVERGEWAERHKQQ